MDYRATRFAFVLCAVCALLAACKGFPYPYPPIPTPTMSATPGASPTAPPIPSSSPFTTATQAPLPLVTAPPAGQTPQPVPVALPSAQGYGGTFNLPIANANAIASNTSAIVTLTDQPPAGVPSTLIRVRTPSQVRRDAPGSQFVPVVFLELFFSGGVTLANQPTITFTVPSNDIVSGASYWVALYDSTRPSLGWQLGFEGPGAVSGTNISFSGGSGSFTFVPFSAYVYALYAQSAAAPSPTPAPTPTPTPVPTPTPTPGATPTPIPPPQFGVSPTSINLYGAGQIQSIAVTGTAPYFALSSNTAVVTVAPNNGNGPFIVTAVGAGSAQITLVDSTGKQAIVPVVVTTTTIPVQ